MGKWGLRDRALKCEKGFGGGKGKEMRVSEMGEMESWGLRDRDLRNRRNG